MDFENKNYEGIYYSRFIASYIKACSYQNVVPKNWKFKEWLRSLTINGKRIPDTVIREMEDLFSNGKLELENNCQTWLREH